VCFATATATAVLFKAIIEATRLETIDIMAKTLRPKDQQGQSPKSKAKIPGETWLTLLDYID